MVKRICAWGVLGALFLTSGAVGFNCDTLSISLNGDPDVDCQACVQSATGKVTNSDEELGGYACIAVDPTQGYNACNEEVWWQDDPDEECISFGRSGQSYDEREWTVRSERDDWGISVSGVYVYIAYPCSGTGKFAYQTWGGTCSGCPGC